MKRQLDGENSTAVKWDPYIKSETIKMEMEAVSMMLMKQEAEKAGKQQVLDGLGVSTEEYAVIENMDEI